MKQETYAHQIVHGDCLEVMAGMDTYLGEKMPNYNKVILMGNLCRSVEVRHISSNTTVGNFGLAVNRKYTTKDGSQKEEVAFVDCTVWGKTAEVMSQYLDKGDPVLIEGRLVTEQWDDKATGAKRSKLSVIVEQFEFAGSGQGGDGGGQPDDGGGDGIDHDDIPF